MVKLYHVYPSTDQRQQVEHVISPGTSSARAIARARILLKAVDGANDEQIVDALRTSRVTVERIRRRFAIEGLEAAITDKPQKGGPRALSSKQAAHLITIACPPTPDGHDHWPLRLSGQKAVERGVDRRKRERVDF